MVVDLRPHMPENGELVSASAGLGFVSLFSLMRESRPFFVRENVAVQGVEGGTGCREMLC